MMVDTTGINKAELLAALYNASAPGGMGFLQYDKAPMTQEEAADILKVTKYFDYLKGRVMKIDLTSDTELNPRLYDRDNGNGAVQIVVDSLRKTGDINNGDIQSMHIAGTETNGLDAMKNMVGTKTKYEKDEDGCAVVTLGADNLSSPLSEAIKKAILK